MLVPEMTINGIDISVYNARLQMFSVSGTTVSNNLSSSDKLLKMPSLFSTDFGTRELSITLTFFPHRSGENSRKTSVAEKLSIAAENITRFEAEICGKTVEISLPDGFIYTAVVKTLPAASFDSSGEHDVTYSFITIRHKAEITLTLPPSGEVYCKSTTNTPCKIVFTLASRYDEITIANIKIKNVEANKEIIIDSIHGTVTSAGNNKFSDTDLISFPILNPGKNIIESTIIKAEITVIYTPVYI